MKITMLGSGSAYGVPYVGGNWGKCNPNNKKNRRLTQSILIEEKKSRTLVDLGPDFNQQSERHKITDVDNILFTHSHMDHIAGNFHIPMLMSYYEKKHLNLFCSQETYDGIKKIFWFQHNHDEDIKVKYYGKSRPIWNVIQHNKSFTFNDILCTPFEQDHGHMKSTGFRINDFAYSTDLTNIPESSYKHLKDLDLWIVECDSLIPSFSHSHLEKTLSWIGKFKPKKAILCHLDHTIDYDTISKQLPENVSLAYDGMEIEL